jgi:dihydroxy-acid dehydratase
LADGDIIHIDVEQRRIDTTADLSVRTFQPNTSPGLPGVLGKYARLVGSAADGAITWERNQ